MHFQLSLIASVLTLVQGVYYRRFEVTSPLSNTIWLTTKTEQITWRNITPAWVEWPTYSNINLRKASDPTFDLVIGTNVTSMDYEYNFNVPKNLPNGDDYFVRIFPIRVNWFGPDGARLKPIISANSNPFVIVGGQGDCKYN
jgi:hypothetical protein